MMDIGLHISKLLFSQKKVVIPKLGVLELETKDVYNHPVSNEFTPKHKVIKFSKNFDAVENNLAKSFQHVNAEKLVSEFVDNIKKSLENNGSFVLKNIGILKMHSSGALIFEQDKDFNYEKSYFGLQAFSANTIENIEEPIVATTQASNEKPKRKFLWLWISVSAAAILLVVFIMYKYIIYQDDTTIVKVKSPIEIDSNAVISQVSNDTLSIDTLANTDSNNIEQDVNIDSINNADVAIAEEQIPVENKVTEPTEHIASKKYYVIAGCFRSDAKAQEYLEEIRQRGYSEASIEGKTNGGLIRVCYAGFDTHTDAKVFMEETANKESKSLWIQKIK